jgi:hypothetical protein
MRDRRWERVSLLPAGVGNIALNLPQQGTLKDPLKNNVLFDLTPWLNKPLGAPGLIDAFLKGAADFRAAYRHAMDLYPTLPSRCEDLRSCSTFGPNYRNPYSVQINFGVQRELRRGLVLSADYVHHHGFHYQIAPDANRVGAADSLRPANALAAMDKLHPSLNCPLGPAGVQCVLDKNKGLPTPKYNIASYAALGLGTASGATSAGDSTMAFPGNNPALSHGRLVPLQRAAVESARLAAGYSLGGAQLDDYRLVRAEPL